MTATRDILKSHLTTIQGAVRRVVEDISDEESLQTVGRYPNHARWLTGHLIITTRYAGISLGGNLSLPDGWSELFKTGASLSSNPGVYPSMEILRERLFDYHRMVLEFLDLLDESELNKEVEIAPGWVSTRMGAVLFLAAHDFYHAGQLEMLRRELGRERSFG